MNFRAPKKNARLPFVLSLVICLGLVVGGVILSELMQLAACPLCVIQRMLYLLLALLAALAIPFAAGPIGRRLAALAMTAAAGTGVFVAGYQVWIQRFSPTTSCSGRPTWWEELVEIAGEQVPILFRASGLCSDPAWKFLSLSIADWSLGFFTLLLLLALYSLFRRI
jgi:protein dithiol:quinone oxidoreductase